MAHRPDYGGNKDLWNYDQTTRRYNPEDSHLRTHHHENLKSYVRRKFTLRFVFLTFPFQGHKTLTATGCVESQLGMMSLRLTKVPHINCKTILNTELPAFCSRDLLTSAKNFGDC